MRLQRVRVARPFEHRGRVYGVGERLLLESNLADELRESGHVLPIVSAEPVQTDAGRWVAPITQ